MFWALVIFNKCAGIVAFCYCFYTVVGNGAAGDNKKKNQKTFFKLKNHTHVKKVGHTSEFLKCKNFNIYNVVFF